MRGCERYREALSARLDGEDPGIPEERSDAPLDICDSCRAWAVAAGGLTGQMAGRDGPPPPPSVLADLVDNADPASGWIGQAVLGGWTLTSATGERICQMP